MQTLSEAAAPKQKEVLVHLEWMQINGEELATVINSVRTLMNFVMRWQNLRRLCTKNDLSAAFLACCLIPFDKNPGLRPMNLSFSDTNIGVGER